MYVHTRRDLGPGVRGAGLPLGERPAADAVRALQAGGPVRLRPALRRPEPLRGQGEQLRGHEPLRRARVRPGAAHRRRLRQDLRAALHPRHALQRLHTCEYSGGGRRGRGRVSRGSWSSMGREA